MRRRHNVIVFALVLLLALTVCQVSAWSAWKPKHLRGFHLVKKLPKTMVAGSTYEMTVDFRNPKRETFRMNVTLEVTEEQFLIGSDEFFVTGTLYAWETPPPKHRHHTRHQEYCDDLIFEEVTVGVFNSTGTVRGKTHNHLTLRISSVPNLMPDTYTFTLTVTLWFDLPSRAVRKLEELKTEINALPDEAFFEEPEEVEEIKEDLVEDINEIIEEINEGDYKEAIKELKDLKKEIRKEIVRPERYALIEKINLTIKILKSLSRGRP